MSRKTVPHSRKLLNKGQIISMGIAVYMVLKPVFNFILLGGALAPIAIGIAALICFYFGVKRSNTVIAILLMLFACAYMPENIRHLGLNPYLIYLLEGIADMLFAVVLAFHPDVRTHCKQSN